MVIPTQSPQISGLRDVSIQMPHALNRVRRIKARTTMGSNGKKFQRRREQRLKSARTAREEMLPAMMEKVEGNASFAIALGKNL